MAFESLHQGIVLQVPELDSLVPRAGRKGLAIGAKGNRINQSCPTSNVPALGKHLSKPQRWLNPPNTPAL